VVTAEEMAGLREPAKLAVAAATAMEVVAQAAEVMAVMEVGRVATEGMESPVWAGKAVG